MKLNLYYITSFFIILFSAILFVVSEFEWKSFEFIMGIIGIIFAMDLIRDSTIEELESRIIKLEKKKK